MTRRLFILAFSLLAISVAYGRQISEQSAKELVLGFYAEKSATHKVAPAVASEINLAHKHMSGENTGLYVFNRGENGGFVIVSADDAVAPILGYSSQGSFSSDNMPPSLRSWLDEYSRQIDYARNAKLEKAAYAESEDFMPIMPLIASLWEQADPYNRMCPEYKGERCLTGCAATALAMVMKYYEHPKTGVGSHSYTPINNRKLGKLTVDFGATTYDWDNMRDEYWWGTYTDEEANAVATLMYHCGVSLDMQYGTMSSGAYSVDWPRALKNYFDYDDGVHLLYREYYSTQGWNELIYNELAAGRPVLYSGVSYEGGHAFVCDGYSADGYFHINWGWAGMSDGYFLLSALDPYEMGSGGSEGGFNFNQTITIGIKPNDGIVDNDYVRITLAGDFLCIGSEGVYDWFSGENDPNGYEGFLNLSAEDTEAEIGVLVKNKVSGEEYTSSTPPTIVESMTGRKVPLDMESLNLADGEYDVYPVCRYAGNENWQIIPVRDKYQQYLTLTVEDGIRTYSNSGVVKHFDLKVTELLTPNKFYCNEVAEFSVIVENLENTYAYEKIYYRCYSQETGEEIYYGGGNLAKPYPYSSYEVNFYLTYMPLEDGVYDIVFYDSMDNLLSEKYEMEVLPGAKLELAECSYNEVIYAERHFNINGSFKNTGVRDFNGTLALRMIDDNGVQGIVRKLGTYSVGVEETAEFNAEFETIEGLEAGREYYIAFSMIIANEYIDVCEPITITVTDESTIEELEADAVDDTEYFNLQGVRIEKPENGLYLRKRGNKVEKVFIK